jgi:RNA 2',3'-cyclic 3'-phosphodiesterase
MNYFVAVRFAPPAGLDEALAAAPAELTRFHPDDLHATVAFLGPMNHARAPQLVEATAAIEMEPVEVRFGRLVALPARRRFSALSFELTEGREPLTATIAQHRDRLIALADARPDRHQPYPHVTVARPPRQLGAGPKQRILDWADAVVPPEGVVVVSELVLFRGNRRDGRLFEVVDSLRRPGLWTA